MEEKLLWLSLSYTLPIAPSSNRVYVWRKLRELGAGSLRQGAALLPDSKQNLQKLRELAIKIRQMGGEATLVQMRFVEEQDCQKMIDTFRRQSAREYRELLLETAQLYQPNHQPPDHTRRTAIQRKYQKAKSRDFFGTQESLDSGGNMGRLLERLELNLDGGWGQLMDELRAGLNELSRVMTGRGENDDKEG